MDIFDLYALWDRTLGRCKTWLVISEPDVIVFHAQFRDCTAKTVVAREDIGLGWQSLILIHGVEMSWKLSKASGICAMHIRGEVDRENI